MTGLRATIRTTTPLLVASTLALGAVLASAPSAGAASPGASGGWTVDTCTAAEDVIDGMWKLIRTSDDPRKIDMYVKISNTIADGYFANCVEAP